MRRRKPLTISPPIFMLTAVFAAAALLKTCQIVQAHKAPSGWEYPSDCCMGWECRPIGCGLIRVNPDGSADWLNYHFYKNGVKMSGDADCHVCIGHSNDAAGKPTSNPHCIYLAPMN